MIWHRAFVVPRPNPPQLPSQNPLAPLGTSRRSTWSRTTREYASACATSAPPSRSRSNFLASQNGERVGCVVTDVCLPGMSGFDLQRALARRHVGLPVIMITGYGDIRAAVRAMKAGAIDFIEKPFSGQLLLDRITYAFRLHGRTRRAEVQREQARQCIALLTRRERQVMDLVVAGNTNRGVATELGVSEKTVELHRGRVMTKLRAANLSELIRIAAWLDRE